MDERKGMAVSGSSSFYMQRGVSSGSVGQQNVGFNAPPVYRSLMSPVVLGQSSDHRSIIEPPFFVDQQHSQGSFTRLNVGAGAPSEVPVIRESVKKKRGRPRKYVHDGAVVSLGLSSGSVSPSMGSVTPTPKKGRGRPPGSGRKQQLASLGGWMNRSAGLAFAPHVIFIGIGEDVAFKIMAFATSKPRALCIMSASGTVSTVTLQQPASGATARYEGRFEILCLSGSYLVAENGSGGQHKRNGGLNVSLSSPDGHVFGGVVGGTLIASSPVQVVACSFVYGGSKGTEKSSSPNAEGSALLQIESAKSDIVGSNQITSSRKMEWRNMHADIDLANG